MRNGWSQQSYPLCEHLPKTGEELRFALNRSDQHIGLRFRETATRARAREWIFVDRLGRQ
jgi:hypothetical protein